MFNDQTYYSPSDTVTVSVCWFHLFCCRCVSSTRQVDRSYWNKSSNISHLELTALLFCSKTCPKVTSYIHLLQHYRVIFLLLPVLFSPLLVLLLENISFLMFLLVSDWIAVTITDNGSALKLSQHITAAKNHNRVTKLSPSLFNLSYKQINKQWGSTT